MVSQEYWLKRQKEILAFRDYARTFSLEKSLQTSKSLSRSGHQLLEIAMQVAFLDLASDALAIARTALEFYEAALVYESHTPERDPRMTPVYQRSYYARWWVGGQEEVAALRQAAQAFCVGLGDDPVTQDAELYLRAVLLWLEGGDLPRAEAWLERAEGMPDLKDSASASLATVRLVVRWQQCEAGVVEACTALQQSLAAAAAWGQPTADTLWQALQLANIRRRYCGPQLDLPGLLQQIR